MQNILNGAGDIIFSRARSAESFKDRLVGLLGRSSLEHDEALFFDNCRAVHMIGMSFPIDVIFLSDRAEIIKIVSRLKPWSFSFTRKARALIEVQAGRCSTLGLNVGQTLTLAEIEHEG